MGVKTINLSGGKVHIEMERTDMDYYQPQDIRHSVSIIDNNSKIDDNELSISNADTDIIEDRINDLMLSDPEEYERLIKEMANK